MRYALCTAALMLPALMFGRQYDHLTIAPDSLMPALAPVCARIESRGVNDTCVSLADVLASSTGRDDQEKIRNFIKSAYSEWGTTAVLLAGDNEQIPCRVCYVDINSTYKDWIPTELYYSALDGDWDKDADDRFGETEDSVDLIPDVLLGRLPLATPAEMQAFADRYLEYTGDSTKPYLQDVLLAGFDYSPGFCGEEACEIYDTLLRPASMHAIKVYDSHSGNHEDSVKHVLDRGVHIWVQYDHCNYNVMGCGYTNHGWLMWWDELDDMTNAPDYSINLAAGCYPSAFDSSYCVAEVLLTAPNGGCVATFGNTRIGFGVSPGPLRTGSHYYCEKALEGFWQGPGNGSFAGLATGQAQAAPFADTNIVWRWCHYQFLLAGEPSMPVWVPAGGGVAETPNAELRTTNATTIVRGVLLLPQLLSPHSSLLSIDGRKVLNLAPGANDVSRLAPGVYFVTAVGARPARVVVLN
ncbi:hypothetical protein JXD38_08175 [candidate division WOR-3 bacterium]|nr:hypothetical protein [candidate division WOR-3 bacterium]